MEREKQIEETKADTLELGQNILLTWLASNFEQCSLRYVDIQSVYEGG